MKKYRKSFLISLAVGALVSAVLYLAGGSSGTGVVHRLCDAFFVAGVLIAGSGGLLFVRNQGLFDIMSYGIKTVFNIHWPWIAPRSKEEGKEAFHEYRLRKREIRKSPAGILLAGAVYLALALVMLAVYTWF